MDVAVKQALQKKARAKIMDLEATMKDMDSSLEWEEVEELYNDHIFAPGVYGRKMLIPRGMCVVGKIHKHAHINVITRGLIKVVTEFGEDIYSGPKIWVSEPGTKRAVYAIEETEWMTIHANPSDTTDIREIEGEVIASSFKALEEGV